jgi:pimeloyl-ACP methyl ester carboxylesterase
MIHLIHGIRQFQAEAHMTPLHDALADLGVPSSFADYGYKLLPITNERAVNALVDSVQDGDDLVGFSNGGWAIHQFLELGLVDVRNVFLISPALNRRAEFPICESVTVYYSAGDWQTGLARVWRKTTDNLPWRWRQPHGWGEMGRVGYQGSDPKVRNIDMGSATGHAWYKHQNIIGMIAQDVYNACA